MATVGEIANEIDHLFGRFFIESLITKSFCTDLLEAVDRDFDHAMFA
jgi:hypothetical protein